MLFKRLGDITAKHAFLILAAWVALLAVCISTAPKWEDVVQNGEFAFLPEDSPSRIATEGFREAFPNDLLASTLVLLVRRESSEGLLKSDYDYLTARVIPEIHKIAQLPMPEDQMAVDAGVESSAMDSFTARALEMISSPRARDAFDISQEDPQLQQRYGQYLFGTSTLIARRLLETGVRFVNVTWDCYWERFKLQNAAWDTHYRNFGIMREYNLPWFDLTYTALLEDLQHRGLLDETLIVVLSEMGRAPRVNKDAGRDHWTHCYSVMFAGAGIRGGSVYGASDFQAAFPKDKPVSTGDICATVYQCLGIDVASTTIPDATGRPHPLASGAQPLWDILA